MSDGRRVVASSLEGRRGPLHLLDVRTTASSDERCDCHSSLSPSHSHSPSPGTSDNVAADTPATVSSCDDSAECDGRSSRGILFPLRLHLLLEEAKRCGPWSDVVSWLPNGKEFKILDVRKFEGEVMPACFCMSKFRSFRKALIAWGFEPSPKEDLAWSHLLFRPGQSLLSLQIKRADCAAKSKRAISSSPSTSQEGGSAKRIIPRFQDRPPLILSTAERNRLFSTASSRRPPTPPSPLSTSSADAPRERRRIPELSLQESAIAGGDDRRGGGHCDKCGGSFPPANSSSSSSVDSL